MARARPMGEHTVDHLKVVANVCHESHLARRYVLEEFLGILVPLGSATVGRMDQRPLVVAGLSTNRKKLECLPPHPPQGDTAPAKGRPQVLLDWISFYN